MEVKTHPETMVAGTYLRQEVQIRVEEPTDVLVVGGGPAGCTAALAAARNGCRVMLVEQSGCLGGMMTKGNAGLTNFIVHNKNIQKQQQVVETLATAPEQVRIVGGLPLEIVERLMQAGHALGTAGDKTGSYVFTSSEEFKWLLLDMMEADGVTLMLHTMAVDVITSNGHINGIVVENKEGRLAVPAKVVIDATGDGDIAAACGCPFVYGIGEDDEAGKGDPSTIGKASPLGVMYRVGNVDMDRCLAFLQNEHSHFGMQGLAHYSLQEVVERYHKGEMVTFTVKSEGTGLQVYHLPDSGTVTLCCPLFAGNGLLWRDLTKAEVTMRDIIRRQLAHVRLIPGFDTCFLLDCPEIGVRETRHIQGDYVLNIHDVLEGRKFIDSIGRGAHTVDAGHVPEHLRKQDVKDNWSFEMPYRCLIPRGVEMLLIAGRNASMTHEAFGCARPTVQCMVMGQAAGTAAALAVDGGVTPRNVDPSRLRDKLVAQGVVL